MTEQVRTIARYSTRGRRALFGARCDACGVQAGGNWTSAGMAAGWAAAHVGLESYDDVPRCEVPR